MTRCVAEKRPLGDGKLKLSLHVEGHANYAESGKDIVCAAVSCLCLSLANTLVATGAEEKHFRMEDGVLHMSATIAENCVYAEGAFDMAVLGLQMIAEQYPNHVEIESGMLR